jgi:hypothetical protein
MVLRLSHLKSWIQKDYIKEYFDEGLQSFKFSKMRIITF